MVSLVVVKPDGSLLETGVGIERPRTHSHGGHLSESASNGSDYEDNRDFKEVGAGYRIVAETHESDWFEGTVA